MTTEQIALLNSFMYFDGLKLDEGKTIEQMRKRIRISHY